MFKRIVREDGSVIILVPKKETKAVTFEVLYKIGSRQETKNNSGVSHFLEHLMFKGTIKRPHTAIIARELDGVGAEYNAFTGKEHTGYYITADSSKLAFSVEILSDLINNSKFDEVEMNRERGVIIEEINMYEDNPLMHIEDVFENLTYQKTSLGRSIAGTKENIKNISRQSLYNYYKKYYYNGNAIFLVGGKFKNKQAVDLINEHFPVKRAKARLKIKPLLKRDQLEPNIDVIKRDLEQVQLMLGFKNIASTNPRFLISQVLGNILGGTMSSRLFLKIREKKGLCYFIKTSSHGYEDISSFVIHTGLNKEKIYEALTAIKEELNIIKFKGITKDELKKAKANIKGRLILKLEDTNSELNFLASQELFNQKIKSLDKKLKELNKISLKQVNNMAKRVINWRNANLAIIGPFTDENKFLDILKNKK